MAAHSDGVHFHGFRRPNGTVGVRNYVAVIPSVFCANGVVEKIAEPFEGVVSLCHPLGCSQVGLDLEITARTLKGLGRNANVGAVLVVGLGCERFTASELAEAVAESGKPVELVLIQQEGGTTPSVEKGRAAMEHLIRAISAQSRERCGVENLTVAVECGGSDASSLIAANPSIGVAIDILIDQGGTAVFSEITELLGTEDALRKRAASNEVAERIEAVMELTRRKLLRSKEEVCGKRSALISPGNVEGGLTTLTEKSLGSLSKSGTRSIVGVLEYAQQIPHHQGVFLMDAPGHDAESVTGMVAGDAQVVIFSTGRGTPAGFPLVPVIKVTGNPETYCRMRENIDVNAGTILEGKMSAREVGEKIFQKILAVASGEQTKAELLGHWELFAIKRG